MKHPLRTLLMAGALMIPATAVLADNVRSDRESRMMYNDSVNRSAGYDMNAQVHYLDRAEVQAIQQALDESGFYSAGVDGIWGPKTVKAVKDFQVSSGLEPTGTINQATLDQLGLQLSAATQVDSENDPIQWKDGRESNRATQDMSYSADRIDGTAYTRAYTHQND